VSSLEFSNLKTGKNLGGFGSLLLALGSLIILPIPILGIFSLLLGIIMLLLGVRNISKHYSEMGIFNNLLRGFGFWIASLMAAIIALSLFEPLGIFIFPILLILMIVVHAEASRLGYLDFNYVVCTLNEYVDYVLTTFFMVLLLPTFLLAFLLMFWAEENALTIAVAISFIITIGSIIFSLIVLKNPIHKLLFLMGMLTIAIIFCFIMAGFSPNFKIISIILAIVASLTLPLLGALCFNDAFTILRVKTGKRSFQIAGWLLAVGVIESLMLNVIGALMVMPIAWIITSIAFFRLKSVKVT
jgi:uncharacterized membrane protein